MLCTDGLIERPGHDIDAAIARLAGLLARHGDGPLPDLVRRISKRLADPRPGDDVVVLAVRVPCRTPSGLVAHVTEPSATPGSAPMMLRRRPGPLRGPAVTQRARHVEREPDP
ncbi:SpoIIE family protein phosphatase [Streptomyces sp. NPDC048045]|uniref:SpoIIE family protein phosphatase n=1 Tax=Streptomyces sp. NPDC048045 TaxID=3154710 RepID=UPI0034254E4C